MNDRGKSDFSKRLLFGPEKIPSVIPFMRFILENRTGQIPESIHRFSLATLGRLGQNYRFIEEYGDEIVP